MREDIVEHLGEAESPNAIVFDETWTKIYHLMLRDSYPRFLTSAQAAHDKGIAAKNRGEHLHELSNKERHQVIL